MKRPLSPQAQQFAAELLARTEAAGVVDPAQDVELRAGLQREANAAARRLRQSKLEESGIRGEIPDDAYALAVDGKLGDTTAFRAVDSWIDVHTGLVAAESGVTPHRIMILGGGTGVGKSCAAAWALARLGGRHTHSDSFAEAFGSRWNDDKALVARILGTRLVVLDDVGAERDKARAAEAIYKFINARQGSPALSILTTNLTQPDLWKTLEARTVSRLAKVGVFIACKGPDLRLGAPVTVPGAQVGRTGT